MKTRKPLATAFTLVELLVVISIITLLASLLMPALSQAMEAGRRTSCLNTIRQLGVAMTGYANDFRGFYPQGPRNDVSGLGVVETDNSGNARNDDAFYNFLTQSAKDSMYLSS